MTANTKIVEKWIDILNRKAVDEIGTVFHDDGYVIYGAGDIGTAHGPEAIGKLLSTFFEAFPDLHSTIEEVYEVEGGRAVGRFLTRGTHTGEIMGIAPTGRTIAISGVAIFHVVDGKVEHEWNIDDLFGLLQQIGVLPMSGRR